MRIDYQRTKDITLVLLFAALFCAPLWVVMLILIVNRCGG